MRSGHPKEMVTQVTNVASLLAGVVRLRADSLPLLPRKGKTSYWGKKIMEKQERCKIRRHKNAENVPARSPGHSFKITVL